MGIEIVKVNLPTSGGLGLNLLEFLRPTDRRKMCVLESVSPNSHAAKSEKFIIGDTISFVNDQRVEGLDLDDTLEIITQQATKSSSVNLTVKRLVKRQALGMTIVDVNDKVISASSVLAGSNLRSEMQKRSIPGTYV
jgi:hypothetical protein